MQGKSKAPEASPGALVRSSRKELTWLAPEKREAVRYREPSTAIGLSMITGGGGYLYAGDTNKGLAGVAAMVGIVASSALLPAGLVWAAAGALAAWGAIGSWRQCRAINAFVWHRAQAQEADGTQNLLASMPRSQGEFAQPAPAALVAPQAPAPGPHGELLARLEKLAAIRSAAVIDDAEHRARKIDILSEAASGLDPQETEALLFALLPALDAGAISEEDIDFVKELGS